MHVVFDNPGCIKNTPKYVEQSRKDQTVKIAEDHYCDDLVSTTKIPGRWREGRLHCHTCKCSLVKFLTSFFLSNISNYMKANQIFYTTGGFDGDLANTAWYVTEKDRPQPNPLFTSNAEEADTRVWVYIQQTQCKQVLLVSPDTDVYNIRLGMCTRMKDKHVVVQVSAIYSRETKLVDLRK